MTEPLQISAETVDADGRPVGVVTVRGEVDLSNSEELAGALTAADEESEGLVVDLSGVPFMDSSGLAVLLAAREPWRRITAVVVPDSPVARLIEIAEVANFIHSFPARDAAVSAHAPGTGDADD